MKELKDMTFAELVQWQRGLITLAIPTGDFNQAVFDACDITLRWKAAQETKGTK